MPAQQIFNVRRPVVAVFKVDHPRRRASGSGEVDEVGVCRNNGESVLTCVLPNRFVRREPSETCVENVDGIGKELRHTADEPRREIRVK